MGWLDKSPHIFLTERGVAVLKRKKNRGVTSLEMKLFPYFLILPNLFIFTAFIAVPALFGAYFSLHNWSGMNEPVFIGLQNYVRAFNDMKFWRSFGKTLIYVGISLPFIMGIPLFLANLMIKEIRGKGMFRAIFYWPSMVSYIIAGISFKFMFGDNTGIINFLLDLFGKSKIGWLTQGRTAMFVVILATIWARTGFYMVTYISGLQSIPVSYYEAAEVDGATPLQGFFKITLPLLKPTTFLVLILSFIDLFKAYGLVLALTGGGPGTATKFVVQYIYEAAFDGKREMGYASALSMILLVVMAVFTLLQFKVNKGGEIE